MNHKLPLLASLLAATCAFAPLAEAQIAVTEFLANPAIPDNEGEFVELFNFGNETVNLNGWTISDEDIDMDLISGSDLFVPPGGYLVLAKNKAALESAFFGGVAQENIVDLPGLTLANGGDEIIISDSSANVIWSLAYPGRPSSGTATFLSEDVFTTTIWGEKASPGIDFSDLDPASDTLAYQDNDVTEDPDAVTSGEDTASPLAGFYTAGGDDGAGFRILSIVPGAAPGSYDLTFESEIDASYSLESGPDLSAFPTQTPVTGTGPTTTVTVSPPPSEQRVFYRVREVAIGVGD